MTCRKNGHGCKDCPADRHSSGEYKKWIKIEQELNTNLKRKLEKENFDNVPEIIFSKNDVKNAKVHIEKHEIPLKTVNNDSTFTNSREKLESDLDKSISKDELNDA
ncbi:hypothetical protein GQX74_010183 [Glossina fuscipes]|nr:hypothetical protein GQX74_010183 [Glossina fuscipes]